MARRAIKTKNSVAKIDKPKGKRGRPKKNKNLEEPIILFDGQEETQEQDFNGSSRTSGESDYKFYQNIGRTRVLDQSEEIELFKMIEKGNPKDLEKAREKIVKHNLRLVCSVARKFCGKGVDFEDLVQEGVFGLSKAIDKFDYKRGYKFSTYATWWIQQSIKQSISKTSRIIRLPSHVIEKYQVIRKAKEEYMKIHNEEISYEQLSEKIDMPIARIQNIERVTQHTYSLDYVMQNNDGGKDDSVANYYIQDEKAEFENDVAGDMQKQMLLKVMERLSDIEQAVLKQKYGFLKKITYEEFLEENQLTKEKAKQIEKTALKKLKRTPELLKLKKELA